MFKNRGACLNYTAHFRSENPGPVNIENYVIVFIINCVLLCLASNFSNLERVTERKLLVEFSFD